MTKKVIKLPHSDALPTTEEGWRRRMNAQFSIVKATELRRKEVHAAFRKAVVEASQRISHAAPRVRSEIHFHSSYLYSNPNHYCWICGKLAHPKRHLYTKALRKLGYSVPVSELGLAHEACLLQVFEELKVQLAPPPSLPSLRLTNYDD